jgi:hypothetical protein
LVVCWAGPKVAYSVAGSAGRSVVEKAARTESCSAAEKDFLWAAWMAVVMVVLMADNWVGWKEVHSAALRACQWAVERAAKTAGN